MAPYIDVQDIIFCNYIGLQTGLSIGEILFGTVSQVRLSCWWIPFAGSNNIMQLAN